MTEEELIRAIEAAIWANDLQTLGNFPQADPTSWGGSVQADFCAFRSAASLPFPTSAGPACQELAVVMMVKDEADIIGANLDWLYFCGVRRFVILDNGSSDGTVTEMRAFRVRNRDAELVIVDDPRISYAQGMKTTGLMRLAVSLWPDLRWTFAVDADEFLIPVQGFGPIVSLSGVFDAITIPKVVHFSAEPVLEDRVGRALAGMPLRNRPFMRAPNVACGAHIHRGVADGNHFAKLIDGRTPVYHGGLSLGLYYREFQIRSAAHFKRKTVNGGPAVLAGLESGQFAGGDHWLHFYRVFQAEGDAGLLQHYLRDCVKQEGSEFIFDPFIGVPAEA